MISGSCHNLACFPPSLLFPPHMLRYEFVGTAQLDSLREAGDLVFEGIDRDELGNIIEVSRHCSIS